MSARGDGDDGAGRRSRTAAPPETGSEDGFRPSALRRESALLLALSLGVVVFGVFEVLSTSVPAASPDRVARGVVVLGLASFGGAALALLGLSPATPAARSGSGVRGRLRRAFFGEAPSPATPGERAEVARRRPGLGWARAGASLGTALLLLAAVLSLTPYAAAVVMTVAGTAGALAMRSP